MKQKHCSLRVVASLIVLTTPMFRREAALPQTQTSSPDCRLAAYLPPMATVGGPVTVKNRQIELGLGFGAYAEIIPSPCIHAGGEDWFVRWRRGLSNRFDLGFDFAVNNQTDGSLGGTGKIAARYQVTNGFRLEVGIGGRRRQSSVRSVQTNDHPRCELD